MKRISGSRRLTMAASATLLGTLGGMTGVSAAENPTATLTPMTEKVVQKVGYYIPQRLAFSATKPAGIKKEPAYAGKPMYGTLHFGAAVKNEFLVALDIAPDNSKATIYVDAERKGDLTTSVTLLTRTVRKIKGQTGQEVEDVLFQGGIKLTPVMEGSTAGAPLSINVFTWDAEGLKRRRVVEGTLLYYRDYGQSGKLTLGGKTYPILLVDEKAAGRYDSYAHGEKEVPPVSLLIDRNGDGKFDPNFEMYDPSKPFNIGGTTYEVGKIAPDGSQVMLKVSTQKVAEVPIPANVSAGQPALAFTHQVIGGKTVNFPKDYKGKVVLLDFWATWCGPCIGELPFLTKAYEKYHSKGFEVLGISLDQIGQEAHVAEFLKTHNMTWDQVYDGKFWKADVAQMYSIQSIPHAFLVDGTTGKILVEGDALRGEALDAEIGKALKTKISSSK